MAWHGMAWHGMEGATGSENERKSEPRMGRGHDRGLANRARAMGYVRTMADHEPLPGTWWYMLDSEALRWNVESRSSSFLLLLLSALP